MKKITLLLLFLAISFSGYAQFPEGFETAVPPSGWATFIGTNGEGTAQDWTTSTTAASGNQAATVRYENVANGAEDWLVTPQFTPSVTGNILTFKQRQSFGSNYGTTYTIRVSTASQTTHADFTIVDTQIETDFGLVFSTHNVDLSAYDGMPIYVAFVMENDDGDSWFVDDVDVIPNAAAPNCAENPTPANGATAVTVTGGEVTIAWDAPSTGDAATGYEVFWGTTSGSLSSLGTLSATTVNITNIDLSTTYYWMVVPENVGGSATGCAEWSFTTEDPPPAPANDLPAGAIAMTLDEGTECGANAITGISNISTTDSGETAPSCGSYGTPTERGDLWYTIVAPASGQVTLNVENLSGLTSVAGAFYSGTAGSFTELDCTEFGSGWPWTIGGLTAGTTYYLRVWDYGNDQTGTFDLCGYFQSCLDVTDIAADVVATDEANITWTAGLSETDWNYEWGDVGFTQGSGTTGSVSTTPAVNLTGLTDGNEYDIYVQADCGGGSNSGWVKFTWTQTVPPANDDCAGAISLTVNADLNCTTVTPGTTVGATTSNVIDDVSGTPNTDVWFSFTATSESHRIELSNVVNQGGGTSTSTDMGMGVYDATGGCASLSLVGSSDPNTYNVSGLTISTVYYVRVYGWSTSVQYNNFDICVGTPPPPPSNDDCANATAVNSLPFNSVGDASSATNNGGFLAPSGCGSMNDGVWYSFTTVDAGTVDVVLSGITGWDPEIAIYTGSCGTFTCVDNADSAGTGSGESLTGIAVDAGTQYWINIGYYSGTTDSSEGPYTLDVTTSDSATVLSVDDNTIEGFSLFPTIVKQELNFTSRDRVDSISIFNLLGQEVLSSKPNLTNSSIDVSSLNGGMYIVKVKAAGAIGTYKIIKE